MERLAIVEQFLAKLKADVDASVFRRSRVVEDGITSGFDEINDAVEHLSEEELEDADRSCKVAWLHAQFARQIFDAEMTEHYLGEGDFLEIGDDISDWHKFAHDEILALEEDIVSLRKDINERAKKN